MRQQPHGCPCLWYHSCPVTFLARSSVQTRFVRPFGPRLRATNARNRPLTSPEVGGGSVALSGLPAGGAVACGFLRRLVR